MSVTDLLRALAERTGEENQQRLSALAKPPQVWQVCLFHLIMDVFVVTAVWVIPSLAQTVR
jgi:hypothetical protein